MENKITYKDLFNVHLKYIDYVLAKSHLSNQYVKNISLSGSEVEEDVRNLFRTILPKRFHVTHGYIAFASNSETEPKISPQVDMIIVDTLVPHSIFTLDSSSGMEIVPVESVVGIFEIKRTLNEKSLVGTRNSKGAFEHLSDIVSAVSVKKDDERRFAVGSIEFGDTIKGGYFSNPIIGIIGLTHSPKLIKTFNEIHPKIENKLKKEEKIFPELDIMFSLDGILLHIGEENSDRVTLANPRKADTNYVFKLFEKNGTTTRTKIIAFSLGYVLGYLQTTCGRNIRADHYFFNSSVF
jgi:hypothetical protein